MNICMCVSDRREGGRGERERERERERSHVFSVLYIIFFKREKRDQEMVHVS